MMAYEFSWHTTAQRSSPTKPKLEGVFPKTEHGHRQEYNSHIYPDQGNHGKRQQQGHDKYAKSGPQRKNISKGGKSSSVESNERSLSSAEGSRGSNEDPQFGTLSYEPNVFWNNPSSSQMPVEGRKEGKKKHKDRKHREKREGREKHSGDKHHKTDKARKIRVR